MLRGSQPVGADHGGGVPVAAGVTSPPPTDTHHDGPANPTTSPGQPTTPAPATPAPATSPRQPTAAAPTAAAEKPTAPAPTATSAPTTATGGTATHDRATVIGPAARAATTVTPENGIDKPTLTTHRESSRTPEFDDHHDQTPAHRGRTNDAGTIRVEPRRHGGKTPLGADRAAPGDRGRCGRHASSPPPPLTETASTASLRWPLETTPRPPTDLPKPHHDPRPAIRNRTRPANPLEALDGLSSRPLRSRAEWCVTQRWLG
jgi:hypothetical protein